MSVEMVDLSDALTIIVPTRNRPDFLRRLLVFMSQMQVRSRIAVIDSSDSARLQENAHTIALYSGALNLRHVSDSTGMIPKCRRAVESVQTAYTVFCADDDFLLPDSVAACIAFLETNTDFGCAMGSWVYLNHNKQNRCHQTRCFPLDDVDPLIRCRKLARNWFSNFYAVYRTEPLRRAWALTDAATDYDRARVFPETLLAQICTLNCRLAILPHLHSLLSLHDDNEHRKSPLIADRASTIELYDRFKDAFANEIHRCSDVTRSRAEAFVEEHYGFLRQVLVDSRGRPSGWSRIKKNIKNQLYTNRDRMSSSQVNIWLRRRLTPQNALCNTPCWQAAYQLATEHPRGMIAHGQVAPRSAA